MENNDRELYEGYQRQIRPRTAIHKDRIVTEQEETTMIKEAIIKLSKKKILHMTKQKP